MNYLSRFRSNWIKRWKESDSFEKIVGGLYALLVLVTVLFLSEEEFKKFARYFAIAGFLILAIIAERLRKAKEELLMCSIFSVRHVAGAFL